MTIQEFQESKFRSRASGNVWTIDNFFEKMRTRSLLECGYAFDWKLDELTCYGDKDWLVLMVWRSSSQWTDSPEIEVHAELALHQTVNKEWHQGWCCQDQYAERANRENKKNLEVLFFVNHPGETDVKSIRTNMEEIGEEKEDALYKLFFGLFYRLKLELVDEYLKEICGKIGEGKKETGRNACPTKKRRERWRNKKK